MLGFFRHQGEHRCWLWREGDVDWEAGEVSRVRRRSSRSRKLHACALHGNARAMPAAARLSGKVRMPGSEYILPPSSAGLSAGDAISNIALWESFLHHLIKHKTKHF